MNERFVEHVAQQQEYFERLLQVVESLTSQCELLCRMNLDLMNLVNATLGLSEGLKQPEKVDLPEGVGAVDLTGKPVMSRK